MYEFDNVPLPRKKTYAFDKMKSGKSFWKSSKALGGVKNLHHSKMARAMRKYASLTGNKFSARVEYNEKGVLGMRFFKI